ncbi:MAG: sulfotransferase [Planctomycetota bacterium]|nr:MAG: sulfotransferase [Planctomycetota bacterium]
MAEQATALVPGGPTTNRSNDLFAPVFVVGCQRSGTTALAVMLDRHSRLAMMPETQFFWSYIKKDRASGGPLTHEAMVRRAIADLFIRQAHLCFDELVTAFRRFEPTYPNLFRAMMEAYALRHGKARSAEKSCNHLFNVDEILRNYPNAKIICIMRDGRDVCRSIKNVPWGSHIPWAGLCRQWNWNAHEALKVQRRLPPDVFTIVRYEDLMLEPERELRRLCAFIGETFEPAQLEHGTGTDVIPEYELGWKGKARNKPDPARVAAWRRNETPEHIAMLNQYMGPALRAWGYPDTQVEGVGLTRRAQWAARYVPYLPGVFPIALAANRTLKRLRGVPDRKPVPEAHVTAAQA